MKRLTNVTQQHRPDRILKKGASPEPVGRLPACDGLAAVRNKYAPCLTALCLLLFSSWGCQYTIEHTPKDLVSIAPEGADLEINGAVRLVNGQTASDEVVVETRSRKLHVDYKDYTDSAVKLLGDALLDTGAKLSESADKSIALSIINLTLTDSISNVRATLDATVKLGNGKLLGFNAQNAGRVEDAVDQAIRAVVIKILRDGDVRAFLAE